MACVWKYHDTSVMQAGRRLFNALPNEIRAARNKETFKILIKKFLFDNMYYNVKEFVSNC
jgi:hypothetical protein